MNWVINFQENDTNSVLLGFKATSHLDTTVYVAVCSELRRVDGMIFRLVSSGNNEALIRCTISIGKEEELVYSFDVHLLF